jgi:hypothetical protein
MASRRAGLAAALLLCLLLFQPALAKRTLVQDVSRRGSHVGMWACAGGGEGRRARRRAAATAPERSSGAAV